MGSTFSIAIALFMTAIVIFLMPEHSDRLAPEKVPLFGAIAITTGLTALSAASFIGELRARPWRLAAHAALIAGLAFATFVYWPR